MRKYAISFLVSGALGVGFSFLMLVFSWLEVLSKGKVYFCLSGIMLSIIFCFYSIGRLTQNGNLFTPITELLKK